RLGRTAIGARYTRARSKASFRRRLCAIGGSPEEMELVPRLRNCHIRRAMCRTRVERQRFAPGISGATDAVLGASSTGAQSGGSRWKTSNQIFTLATKALLPDPSRLRWAPPIPAQPSAFPESNVDPQARLIRKSTQHDSGACAPASVSFRIATTLI